MKSFPKHALTAVAAMTVSMALSMDIASARSINATVKSGVATTVETVGIFSKRGCLVGPRPRARVATQPKNGKLTIQRFDTRIPQGRACAGTKIPGVKFVYRSNRGFRGRDRASVSVVFPKFINGSGVAQQSRGLNFNINVK